MIWTRVLDIFLLFGEAVGVLLLPVPAVADHLFDAVLGFPAQLAFGFGGVAVAGGDVAGTAGLDAVGHLDTVHLDEGVDHVEDAVAVACAEVVDVEAAAALDGLEGADVAAGEIDDVDIVAHAGAVGGVIIVAEDAQLGTFAHGDLGNVGHEVVGDAVGVLSYRAALVRTHGVEIAEEDDVPFGVGLLDVDEYLFKHTLGPAVGVGALTLGTCLGDGDLSGVAIDGGARGEDDILAAVLTQHVEEHEGAGDVVVIVLPRFGDALAHGLEAGEMDAGVKMVLLHDFAEAFAVADIDLMERYLGDADNLCRTAQGDGA